MREVAGIGPQTVMSSGWEWGLDPKAIPKTIRVCCRQHPGFEETFA